MLIWLSICTSVCVILFIMFVILPRRLLNVISQSMLTKTVTVTEKVIFGREKHEKISLNVQPKYNVLKTVASPAQCSA